MKTFAILALLFSPFSFAQTPACPKPGDKEEFVYSNDFKWGVGLAEMDAKFKEIYSSGKRLKGRAYLDAASGAYVFELDGGMLVKIDPEFIASVTKHVETALERRYADYVFFPDMGHSHFHIPEKDWVEVSKHTANRKDAYETMMKTRSMKILYHTAEQLKVREGEHSEGAFPQDKILLWRYHARNVVGDNQGGENVFTLFFFEDKPDYNTVGEIAGHHLWSAGFNISSSKNGCFPYKYMGKTLYFDLSLEDLPYGGNGDGAY